jgi:flavin reductase (DIM6/NTAB) family NADH-FMN oxidoreductase RutF
VRISQGFGGRLSGAERFKSGNWTLARRLPFLVDAQANLFCRVETRTHFGTHGIFIGSVEEARFSGEATPLVYQDGHYVTTSPLVDS